jgi:hypothetical protein
LANAIGRACLPLGLPIGRAPPRQQCLDHSAPHLSFLLVRLGVFAADYFRDYPSALRAAGLSEARCGGFGEAEARLITIGELDASRLESGSTGGAVLIFSAFLLLASEGERRGPRHFRR